MTEFARGLLVGLFLGAMLGGLVVAVLLLRWWTGALEEIPRPRAAAARPARRLSRNDYLSAAGNAGFHAAKAMAYAAVAQAVELEYMNAVLSAELHLIGERLESIELTAKLILLELRKDEDA